MGIPDFELNTVLINADSPVNLFISEVKTSFPVNKNGSIQSNLGIMQEGTRLENERRNIRLKSIFIYFLIVLITVGIETLYELITASSFSIDTHALTYLLFEVTAIPGAFLFGKRLPLTASAIKDPIVQNLALFSFDRLDCDKASDIKNAFCDMDTFSSEHPVFEDNLLMHSWYRTKKRIQGLNSLQKIPYIQAMAKQSQLLVLEPQITFEAIADFVLSLIVLSISVWATYSYGIPSFVKAIALGVFVELSFLYLGALRGRFLAKEIKGNLVIAFLLEGKLVGDSRAQETFYSQRLTMPESFQPFLEADPDGCLRLLLSNARKNHLLFFSSDFSVSKEQDCVILYCRTPVEASLLFECLASQN
jgi:hypothetical protein